MILHYTELKTGLSSKCKYEGDVELKAGYEVLLGANGKPAIIDLITENPPNISGMIKVPKLYNIVVTKKSNKNMEDKNKKGSGMMSKLVENYKSRFIPQVDEDIKMTMDGNICFPYGSGYVSFSDDESLVFYEDEMVMHVPVFTMNKPVKDIKDGDFIKNSKGKYCKVLGRNKDGFLRCLTVSGSKVTNTVAKDFLTNDTFVSVVVDLFSQGGVNPMMLMLMAGDEKLDMKNLMLMQMMQNGSSGSMFGNINPMMLMMMSDGEFDLSTIMMMQIMQGGVSK